MITSEVGPEQAVESYLELAVQGDTRAGVRLTLDLLDRGVPEDDVIVSLLAAAQHEVGERWFRNVWTVADEHLVSGCTQRALDALANTADLPEASGVLVVACAQGDWHSLPAQMLAELLRAQGFTVLFLGASTPVEHVSAFLSRRAVDAVLVSCNMPMFFLGVINLVDVAHRHGIPVVVGGRAVAGRPQRAVRLGADASTTDVGEVVTILREWQQVRPRVRSEPVLVEPGAVQLDRRAAEIGQAALERLRVGYPAMAEYDARQLARTEEDLGYVTRFIAAARLVDDPSVLTDFIDWLGAMLASRGVPPAAVSAGLEALAPVVGAVDPPSEQLVRAIGPKPVSR